MHGNSTQQNQKFSQKEVNALLTALNKTMIVSMTDKNGIIVYANEKFEEISKYTLDELIGQNHRILKSGHQPDELFVDLWKTISSGKTWHGEIKNKAKDGSYYWADSLVSPVFDDAGQIEQYVSIRVLINDRKKLEEELHEKMRVLTELNEAMIERELKMIELKKRIKEFEEKQHENL